MRARFAQSSGCDAAGPLLRLTVVRRMVGVGSKLHGRLRPLCLGAVLLLAACGGGGADPIVEPGPEPYRPDIALLLVSGHDDFAPTAAYLALDAGPVLRDALVAAGRSVQVGYYVDDPDPVEDSPGFYGLLADMRFLRDVWVPRGTRVVLVAHSHGGVWAHAACRDVPGLAVECLIDLDCSSYGWEFVHVGQESVLGGDPRGAYDIGLYFVPPGYESVPTETSGVYDYEDVVWPNVLAALEVRSGDSFPIALEWYDEVWNVRRSGATNGLSYYFSDTDHSEVHAANGTTLPVVEAWLLERLGL